MVLVKIWPFFNLFFCDNIGQENVFYDILERKNVFLRYKNKNFKKSKNWHFSKGVTHGFVQNLPFFNIFFWGNIGKKNVFYDIVAQKKEFLCYKKKSLKSRIIEIFPKGLTHGFGLNMAIFQPFFLWQYRPGKCLLRYSRTKKCLFTL